MPKANFTLLDGPCPRDELLTTEWMGVACYDDAIVFRAGKSLLILDDSGLNVNVPDIVLNTPKEESTTS